MRLALLAAVSTAAGLAACAPVEPAGYGYGYGYSAPVAPNYGYYDGGYATPYYAEPAYPGYVGGGTIILGGERRYYDRGYRPPPPPPPGRFRDEPRDFGRPPPRDFGRPPPRDFGRPPPGPGPGPGPGPAPISRPPPPQPGPGPMPMPGPIGGRNAHSPEFNPANPTAHGGADR